MLELALFLSGALISAVAIRYGIAASYRYGVVDRPGGHKQHDTVTPFVGGIGVLAAVVTAFLVLAWRYPDEALRMIPLMVGAALIFATGFLDDLYHLHYNTRFAVQSGVALMMIYWGGVTLTDLGYLDGGSVLPLGPFGIVLTLVATLGAINSLNMIDGIDGLAGSLALVCLLMTSAAIVVAGRDAYLVLTLTVAGGLGGFLHFNLRHAGRSRAECFLGDNGSMLLGFLVAWLFCDLSQGPRRALAPVTTLWLFAVPLLDTLSVMLRRLWLGRSPFRADRHHLHHLFLRAGFRVQDTVIVLAMMQVIYGTTGLLGMYYGVDESWMMAGFAVSFAASFLLVLRPWRFVPALRRLHGLLQLTSSDAAGIYVRGLRESHFDELASVLSREIGRSCCYCFSIYAEPGTQNANGVACSYGVIELVGVNPDLLPAQIRRVMHVLKRRFRGDRDLQIRQYVRRSTTNERRAGSRPNRQEHRRHERRLGREQKFLCRVGGNAGQSAALSV